MTSISHVVTVLVCSGTTATDMQFSSPLSIQNWTYVCMHAHTQWLNS